MIGSAAGLARATATEHGFWGFKPQLTSFSHHCTSYRWHTAAPASRLSLQVSEHFRVPCRRSSQVTHPPAYLPHSAGTVPFSRLLPRRLQSAQQAQHKVLCRQVQWSPRASKALTVRRPRPTNPPLSSSQPCWTAASLGVQGTYRSQSRAPVQQQARAAGHRLWSSLVYSFSPPDINNGESSQTGSPNI